jgi:hypothetical protein
MKQIAGIIASLFFIIQAEAQQLDRWKYLLSSDLGGFMNTKDIYKIGDSSWTEDFSTEGIYINPKIGYFVANGFAIGLETTLGTSKSHYSSTFSSTTDWLGIGPFIRYYFKHGKASPFIEAGAGKLDRKQTVNLSYTEIVYKYPGRNAHIGPGIAFFMGEKASLEGIVEYQIEQYDDNSGAYLTKRRHSGFVIKFGASFFL